MSPRSAPATEVARRFWVRASGNSSSPAAVAAAVERSRVQLRTELSRWIGAEGYRVLLDQALKLARAEYPSLGALPLVGGAEPVGPVAVKAQGTREVAASLVALVAALTVLLGRIIGEELALHMVEQAALPQSRNGVHGRTKGGRNG